MRTTLRTLAEHRKEDCRAIEQPVDCDAENEDRNYSEHDTASNRQHANSMRLFKGKIKLFSPWEWDQSAIYAGGRGDSATGLQKVPGKEFSLSRELRSTFAASPWCAGSGSALGLYGKALVVEPVFMRVCLECADCVRPKMATDILAFWDLPGPAADKKLDESQHINGEGIEERRSGNFSNDAT